MPFFLQYMLEANACLLIFAGTYLLVFGKAPAFRWKRRYLRSMAAASFLLPLLPIFFLENQQLTAGEMIKMNLIEKWMLEIPDFSITAGTILLSVFFCGFMAAAFRLADKLWAIRQFLIEKNNRPGYAFGWQGHAGIYFSQLIFNWDHWSEERKNAWAGHWLPIHPVFAWEALLVEVFFALNWWNPLIRWYRKEWKTIFRQDLATPATARFTLVKKVSAVLPFLAVLATFTIFSKTIASATESIRRVDAWGDFVIFQHKKPVTHSYAFEWGSLSIPLNKYANPNGYEGSAEIELIDFQHIINDEIKIFRDYDLLQPGVLSLLYRSGTSGEQAYINDIDHQQVVLKDRRHDRIYNDSLGPGDELIIFGETEDIYLSRIVIKIMDPDASYEPVVNVPDINHLDAEFSFQIIARPGDRTLVKIDASHPNALKIKEMYGNRDLYEIIEIPGFRTNRRYLTPTEALLSRFDAQEQDLASGLPDVNYLPEYQGYQNQPVSLRWGQLEAAPTGWSYQMEQFDSVTWTEPQLLIGEMQLRLEAFEIIIAGKNGKPAGYRTDRLDYFALRQALGKVQPESSIYFDRIVVKDEDGALKLFPAAFAFHIAKNPPKDISPPKDTSQFFIHFGSKTEVSELNFQKDSLLDARRKDAGQQHW